MVTSIRFADMKEFNLFCKLQELKKREIIDIFHDKGNILLILDRDFSETAEWEKRKARFMKELKGV